MTNSKKMVYQHGALLVKETQTDNENIPMKWGF